MDSLDVVRALRAGIATLDALAARTGAPTRDALLWALEEARIAGWAEPAGGEECGPDGLCGSAPPVIWRLTEAGRRATAAA
jgi:hypothetical protein